MGGDDDRIGYLLHKSLLGRVSVDLYEMHTNTRSYASDLHEQIDGASGLRETRITAAQMYSNVGIEKGDLGRILESRWFFYTAGEYDTAGELVQRLTEPLHTWGFIDLVRELNEKTVETATSTVRAAALHHLGIIYQAQGMYDEAEKKYQESLEIFEELGDTRGIASTLHQLGMIHQDQGRYDEAEEIYQESLKIAKDGGNKRAIARTLHQLGTIHQQHGRYDEAVTMYQESLKMAEELGNRSGIASTLGQMGTIHQAQGRYNEAVMMYQESLKVSEELGDRSGMAGTLGQMGRIFQAQENYKEALRSYFNAFAIFHELNSPYKDLVGRDLMTLKEEMGDALFDRYCEEMTADE